MKKIKVAAIVPAYNEEANIGNVLKVLLASPELDEVIVVDDGSTDQTAQISREMGAKVIRLANNQGKGQAMREGVKATQAEIIVFLDADLIDLQLNHISLLVKPILERKTAMTIGIKERGRWKGKLAKFFVEIDPLLAIGGERAMRRFVFENLPQKLVKGFAVETALNYYCQINQLPVQYVNLKGLDIVVKEKKWGLIKGFLIRLKMMWEVSKARVLILIWLGNLK